MDGRSLTWAAEEGGRTHFVRITRLFVEHIRKGLLPRLITGSDIIVQYKYKMNEGSTDVWKTRES